MIDLLRTKVVHTKYTTHTRGSMSLPLVQTGCVFNHKSEKRGNTINTLYGTSSTMVVPSNSRRLQS